jgi:transposase
VGVQLREQTPAAALGRVDAGAFWQVETIAELLETQYGVRYRSVRSLHALLEDSGLSYQRPERVYRSRPAEAVIAAFDADAEKK